MVSNLHHLPRSHVMKVEVILSLKFKINLISYFIREFMKNVGLKFFYEVEDKVSIKVKRKSELQNSPRLR